MRFIKKQKCGIRTVTVSYFNALMQTVFMRHDKKGIFFTFSTAVWEKSNGRFNLPKIVTDLHSALSLLTVSLYGKGILAFVLMSVDADFHLVIFSTKL